MSTPDVEEQVPVQTPNIEKHRLLRYALLIAAASYVILSSYYISGTRSSLASLAVAQKAAIANLQQRQAATGQEFSCIACDLTGTRNLREVQRHYGPQCGKRNVCCGWGQFGEHQTMSYGKEKPVCTEHDESCWQQNCPDHLSP